ncbi:flagellar assembly protein FliW [Cohnella thailandensis]|uniref:Flagellar assembly factor FliW n=1 Tax=Cohnella thailandensis TaxID=557557 RepID=A0A841SRR5_9BACL|nr:flagellar assembly protein FliW [Cohnella thailandensis]MBB6632590.1 flagellar assembly protein FliW [Cohnella thailandensis]MBP1971884.1 flagellar assembly factor FliW [Cohnella thailandensis]
MKIVTTRFGELTVREDEVFLFSKGIPGFEERRQYFFVRPEEHAPFEYLQSAEEGELAFILVDPFLFFPNYSFELSDQALADLGDPSQDSLFIRVIVSIRGELKEATANLVAPVVLNSQDRLGQQVVLSSSSEYEVRHRLFPLTTGSAGRG